MTATNSRPNPPRVLDQVLRIGRLVNTIAGMHGARLDKERLCYLVTDKEWQQLVDYQLSINYTTGADNPDGMESMSILGVEIVKRSAIMRSYK